MGIEIVCTRCGAEAFLKREPVYEGLKKTGDELSCSACGFVFAGEAEVPFKACPAAPKIFDEGENKRICRYCADYVVNPFMQFCSHHKKEVQATDSCPQFSTAPEKPSRPVF